MPGTPLYPKDMATEWAKLKRDIKSTFTSANSKPAYQKIAASLLNVASGLVVLAGAYFRFVYNNGNTGMYMGAFEVGGEPSEGMVVYKASGNAAFLSYSRVSDGTGFTGIYDGEGNIVVSDDALNGAGLATPWIPLTFAPTAELTAPPSNRVTSSTSDTVIYSAYIPLQHPKLRLNAYIDIVVGGSTVNYKVKNVATGVTLLSGTTSGGYITDDFEIDELNYCANHQLDITIRRASGSGDVGITVLSLTGRQS